MASTPRSIRFKSKYQKTYICPAGSGERLTSNVVQVVGQIENSWLWKTEVSVAFLPITWGPVLAVRGYTHLLFLLCIWIPSTKNYLNWDIAILWITRSNLGTISLYFDLEISLALKRSDRLHCAQMVNPEYLPDLNSVALITFAKTLFLCNLTF